MNSKTIIMLVQMEFNPSKREDALAILRVLASKSQAEDGCEAYDFVMKKDAGNKVILLERWTDGSTFAAHGNSAHLKEALHALKPMMSKPISMEHCLPV